MSNTNDTKVTNINFSNVLQGNFSPEDFNQTSLAVKESIKEIFDDFTQVLSTEFEYKKVDDLNSRWNNLN